MNPIESLLQTLSWRDMGEHRREIPSPTRASRAWRRIRTKRLGPDRPAALDEKVAKLTMAALASPRGLARYKCCSVRSDHPGIEGYSDGRCRGCRCRVLINEQIREAAGKRPEIVAFLCPDCFEVSASVTLPGPRNEDDENTYKAAY